MRVRGMLVGGAVALALLGTVVAVATAPDSTAIVGFFPARGGIGDTVVARELTVVVIDVSLARQLETGQYGVGNTATDGVWVIVTAQVTPGVEPVVLSNATVSIDGIHYRASNILRGASLTSVPYGPGVPVHGDLVFELPAAALKSPAAAHATVTFNYTLDPRNDTVPVVSIDLSGLDVASRAVIDDPYVVDTK